MSDSIEHTIESNQDNFDPESMLQDLGESHEELLRESVDPFSQIQINYLAPKSATTQTYTVNTLTLDIGKDKKIIVVNACDMTVDMLKDLQNPQCSLSVNFSNKSYLYQGYVESFVYSKEKYSVPSIELHLA